MAVKIQSFSYRIVENNDDVFFNFAACSNIGRTRYEIQELIEACAMDFINRSDENAVTAFPLTIALHEPNGGQEIAQMFVECELVPQFSAYAINQED